MIAERFRLDAREEAGMLAELRGGLVRQIVPDDAVTRALRAARAAGWVPFVVTNGTVQQQERKLRHTGLDREVAGWVISEGAGPRKQEIPEEPLQRAINVHEGATYSTADIDSATQALLDLDVFSAWRSPRRWPTPLPPTPSSRSRSKSNPFDCAK